MSHSHERVASPSGAPADAFTREATYAATRRPVGFAQTLTPEAYTSEAFFAVERERVFGTSWVAVGCSAQLRDPGDVLVTEVAVRSIFVLRNKDGQLRAFYNACRHRGTQLLTPDQQAVFDMEDVKEFDRADYGLLQVAVDSWGPLVFVNLEPHPAPLSEDLGDLPARTAGHRLEEWEIARVAEYEIAANYKLVGENFMEYYHLPWVHPGLVQVSPIEAHHRWQGPGMYAGFCTTPIAPDTEEGGWGSGLPPISGLDASDAVSARFIWLFPNVAVNILPNHLFIILARATSPRKTHETTYLLTHPESTGDRDREQALDQLMGFWDAVNREDIGIVERVQAGLDSTPFPGGRLCYRFEDSLHRFQNMVIDRMVGKRRVPPGDEVEAEPMFKRSAGDS